MTVKIIAGIIGIIVLVIGINFGSEELRIKWRSHFEPKHKAIDREVFKQSRAFTEGKIQELSKMKYEFAKGDDVIKSAIASRVRHQFADYDKDLLPTELRSFVTACNTY